MLADQLGAPPRSDRPVLAFAIGWLLLAGIPPILTAFDEAIDRGLQISDLWPDFWTLLAQVEPWWIGGMILGAAFIGGRSLVNRLRKNSVGYLISTAIWWLLLSIAPILLVGAIAGASHQSLSSDVRGLIGQLIVAWFFGVALVLGFIGGNKLRARSSAFYHVTGNVICGLLFAILPLMLMLEAMIIYRAQHHGDVPPDVMRLIGAITLLSYFAVIPVPVFIGVRRLLSRYVTPESPLHIIIVAAGWILLAMVPPFLIGVGLVISGRAHVGDSTRELVDQIAMLCFGVVILLAAFRQGRVVGDGDVRAGLGDAPVSNRVLVNWLAVAGAAYAVVVSVVLHNFRRGLAPTLLIIPDAPAHNLFVFFAGVCLAPLSEELFLRGWMWTGLRKKCAAQSTAMLTGGLWLLLHLANGVGAPFGLLPVAIILSAARHAGQSVRAPIAIHAIYNLAILLLS